jgi:hypothetical protein
MSKLTLRVFQVKGSECSATTIAKNTTNVKVLKTKALLSPSRVTAGRRAGRLSVAVQLRPNDYGGTPSGAIPLLSPVAFHIRMILRPLWLSSGFARTVDPPKIPRIGSAFLGFESKITRWNVIGSCGWSLIVVD